MASLTMMSTVEELVAHLGIADPPRDTYLAKFSELGIRTVADLTASSEERLAEHGIMRGHCRRLFIEVERIRRAMASPAGSPTAGTGGMAERHSSLLEPTPTATPTVRDGRAFPSTDDLSSDTSPHHARPFRVALPSTGDATERHSDTTRASAQLQAQDFACLICMDFIVSARTMECGHSFCSHCITQWCEGRTEPNCPLCRHPLFAASAGRFVLPPVNKMLDEISRKAYPERYAIAKARSDTAQRDAWLVKRAYLFTRHPQNALLVRVLKNSGTAGSYVTSAVEKLFLSIPRCEFTLMPMTTAALQMSVETGTTPVTGLNFNVTASTLQAVIMRSLDIHPGHSFLEIGTGSGVMAAWAAALAGRNGRVLSIDSDEAACAFARRNIAVQARAAECGIPPIKPLHLQHPTTWWVHTGAVMRGFATPIVSQPKPEAGSRSASVSGSPNTGVSPPTHHVDPSPTPVAPDEHDMYMRITHVGDDGSVEGLVVSGSERQRRAIVRGKIKMRQKAHDAGAGRDSSSGSSAARPLKNVRARSDSDLKRQSPAARAASPARAPEPALVSSDDSADAAWAALTSVDAIIHVEEVSLLTDSPHDVYCFLPSQAARGAARSAAERAAPSLENDQRNQYLHYVLRLTTTTRASSVAHLTSVNGFVSLKTPASKLVKLAEVHMSLDTDTVARIAAWASSPYATRDTANDPDADLATALRNVVVAQCNGTAILDNTDADVTNLLGDFAQPNAAERDFEHRGIFDRIFCGCETTREQFEQLVKLLREDGVVVLPFDGDLIVAQRRGLELVGDRLMSVTFGKLLPVGANEPPLTSEFVRGLFDQRCFGCPYSEKLLAAERRARPLNAKAQFAACCDAPIANEAYEVDMSRIFGGQPPLLDGRARCFLAAESAARITSDVRIYVPALGCMVHPVTCPCNKVVGYVVAEQPRRALPGEAWEGVFLLCDKYLSSARRASETALRSTQREERITCGACNQVVAVKTQLIDKLIEWADTSLPNAPVSNASLVNNVLLDNVQLAPVTSRVVTGIHLRFRPMRCSACHAMLGCQFVACHSVLDVPAFLANVERYALLNSRVKGVQRVERLDALQRVFHALMQPGFAASGSMPAGARGPMGRPAAFSAGELMELFEDPDNAFDSSDSDDDEPPATI